MSQRIKNIIGGTITFASLYMILFAGSPRFNSDIAEHMLADVSNHLSNIANTRSAEAKLQYSNVEVHGFAYDKWARIIKPSVNWSFQGWQEVRSLGFSTDNADLIPDPSSHQHIAFRFSDVVNVIAGSELLSRIKLETPFLYSINYGRDGQATHRLLIPKQLSLLFPTHTEQAHLSLAKPAIADITISDEGRNLRSSLITDQTHIQVGDSTWSANGMELHYDTQQKSSETTEGKLRIALDHATLSFANATTKPYTLTAALSTREQRNISGATDAISVAIDQGIVTDGNLRITANGTMNFDIDDAAYGELVIEINNAAQFLHSDLIAKDKHALAAELLSHIIGADVRERKQLIITIVREKNGAWMVGKMPLSALLDKGLWSVLVFYPERNEVKSKNLSQVEKDPSATLGISDIKEQK